MSVDMETRSVLLDVAWGTQRWPVTDGFHSHKGPMMSSFDIFFELEGYQVLVLNMWRTNGVTCPGLRHAQ